MVVRFDSNLIKDVVERRSDTTGIEGEAIEAGQILKGAEPNLANTIRSGVEPSLEEVKDEELSRESVESLGPDNLAIGVERASRPDVENKTRNSRDE
jgi:hypothetical protein